MSWDELDINVYNTLKESIRKAYRAISKGEYKPYAFPVVLVDFYSWESFYFEDEFEAEKYVKENYGNDWDEPPEGENEE